MADLITRTDHGGRTWTFDPEFRTWRVESSGLLVICAGHRPGGRTERWQTSGGFVCLDVDDAMTREAAAHDAFLSAIDTMQENHDQALDLAGETHRQEVAFWRRVATSCLLVAIAVSILAAVL